MIALLGVLFLFFSGILWIGLMVGLIRPNWSTKFPIINKFMGQNPGRGKVLKVFGIPWLALGIIGVALMPDQEQKQYTNEQVKYSIIETRDTSHGTARRVTFWVKMAEDYNRSEMRWIITSEMNKLKSQYDIVWLVLVTPNAEQRSEYYGWFPARCKTKWISPDLDEILHTKIAGPETGDETIDGIVIAWTDHNDKPKQSTENTSNEQVVSQQPKQALKWVEVTTLSGQGNKKSAIFELTGNEARLRYTCTGGDVSMLYIYVLKEGTQLMVDGGIPEVMSQESHVEDESYLYVGSGRYYLEVSSANNKWSVIVEENK